ncbi:hypothetical protein M752DRAFT_23287 [Aspergillus phoenicis ATCC 13157]|uniref:Uncharacterized protein n=1 Tax=Aspergillus phoenicis ATCC 13157 TaxID=1353007 RepID=A0A370PIH4_ASPPH|nr:hypothetical protein M752DRAFT_23287 [Aspergillus phoenicis ATCC 13157]
MGGHKLNERMIGGRLGQRGEGGFGGGREEGKREKGITRQAPDAVTALAFTSSKTKRRSWVRAVGTEEAVDDEAGLVKKAMVQIRNKII